MKNSIFEIPVIQQTLNINNKTNTRAKSIILHITSGQHEKYIKGDHSSLLKGKSNKWIGGQVDQEKNMITHN